MKKQANVGFGLCQSAITSDLVLATMRVASTANGALMDALTLQPELQFA